MCFAITKDNSYLYGYKQHAWNVYLDKQAKLPTKAVNKTFGVFEAMLSRYSKVFVLRVDLHPQSFNQDNQLISQFLSEQQSKLKTRYQCECALICAREQKTSNKEHYHLAIFLSGHEIRHSTGLVESLRNDWNAISGGSMHIPENCYCNVYRGDRRSLVSAVYRVSYLTKRSTKELNPNGCAGLIFRIPQAQKAENHDTDLLLVDPKLSKPITVLHSWFSRKGEIPKQTPPQQAINARTSRLKRSKPSLANQAKPKKQQSSCWLRSPHANGEQLQPDNTIMTAKPYSDTRANLNPSYRYRDETLAERWIHKAHNG